jgi:excisionase family DNA binding protein
MSAKTVNYRKKVFTTGDVAEICEVSARTVQKWFDSGRLRGYRIPGSQDRRIPRENLLKFLSQHNIPLGEFEASFSVNVLFVSQDAVICQVAQKVLCESAGFRTVFADNAFEAGTKFNSFSVAPDFVVVDFDMGSSEAQNICKGMQLGGKNPNTEVVAIISDATPSGLQPLANLSFKKPFSFDFFAIRLKELVKLK